MCSIKKSGILQQLIFFEDIENDRYIFYMKVYIEYKNDK